jgi:hypothetical protein
MTDRNDPCPCGSGKKFKKCHGAKGEAAPPVAKAKPAEPASVTAQEEPTSAEPLHTHRQANPAKSDAARKRHLQRRTDAPALRGSLFYKLTD